jgi:hypothetical protein
MIEDLQKEIERVKARAAQAKVKKDPALRHINASVKAIDKAADATGDAATRKALAKARATLSSCLELGGAAAPKTKGPSVEPKSVLTYLVKHPASRAEDIASALGTDTTALRPVVKKLIEARQVKAKGKARGMRYSAAAK